MIVQSCVNRLEEEQVVERYANYLANTYKNLEKEIVYEYSKVDNDPGKFSVVRKKELAKQILVELKSYSSVIKDDLILTMLKTYEDEVDYSTKFFKEKFGMTTDFKKLPTSKLKAIVGDIQIKGLSFDEWIDKTGRDIAFEVKKEVFDGIARGKKSDYVVKRLREQYNLSAKRAEAIGRSWYSRATDVARRDTYTRYGVDRVTHVTKFSKHTCPVCISMHGRTYEVDKAPALPLHVKCHCLYIANIRGRDFTNVWEDWYTADIRPAEELQYIRKQFDRYKKKMSKADFDKHTQILDKAIEVKLKHV